MLLMHVTWLVTWLLWTITVPVWGEVNENITTYLRWRFINILAVQHQDTGNLFIDLVLTSTNLGGILVWNTMVVCSPPGIYYNFKTCDVNFPPPPSPTMASIWTSVGVQSWFLCYVARSKSTKIALTAYMYFYVICKSIKSLLAKWRFKIPFHWRPGWKLVAKHLFVRVIATFLRVTQNI